MLFIWIAIGAYLLLAVAAVIDKLLLHETHIGHPATYAFSTGLLSLTAIVLAPFGFAFPTLGNLVLALVAGTIFTYALLAYYSAVKQSEASRIVPIEAGFVPFFTLIFSFFILGERFKISYLVAFAFLVTGSVLISYQKGAKKPQPRAALIWALAAAFLFALSLTLLKAVYGNLGFVNGFIWNGIGMAVGAVTLLLDGQTRRQILHRARHAAHQTGILFLVGQLIGGGAGIAQNYAISLGSVSLVNALQGTQFVFLVGLTTFLSLWFPKILREEFSRDVLIQKIAAVVVIALGVAFLAF